MWQTRFLAPADTPDGTHHVQLVLKDAQGNAYREEKTFVIASKPPVVRTTLDRTSYHRGETVRLQVSASQTTRTIVARMYGVAPIRLAWNAEARSNTGEFRIPDDLPAGQYTLYASRGFEYSVHTQQVTLPPGRTYPLPMRIHREVPTPGLVACDTHVHTFTYSHHGDATVDERALTLAGEGIELPIATDHDILTDYAEPARRMGVLGHFTPVIGDEVTTEAGHFNIFPVTPGSRVPDPRITDWPQLMRELRGTPGVRVIVLNHPRNIHSNFQPFAEKNFNPVTGENRRGFEFSFDSLFFG